MIAVPHETRIPDYDVDVFYGSEHDVLSRYAECAEKYKFDVVVRITSDCPLIPPAEIDRVIEAFLESGVDYATNRPGVVDGWDVEVFSRKVLDDAHKEATDIYDREHVTPWIRENPYIKCLTLSAPKLSLDTESDLERIISFYELERKSYSNNWWDGKLRNEFHPLPFKA